MDQRDGRVVVDEVASVVVWDAIEKVDLNRSGDLFIMAYLSTKTGGGG